MTRYETSGTCARLIEVETDGRTVLGVRLYGGCMGQGAALSALVTGMPIRDVVRRLRGIRCGSKPTSCGDQLARALELELRDGQKDWPDRKDADRVVKNRRRRK